MTSKRTSPAVVANNWITHGLLIVFVVLAIGPILVVIMNSFKTTQGIFLSPFLPPTAETFNLQGYENVFKRGEFFLNYQNSIVVTVSTTVLTILLATLAAWALTEYKVRIAPLLAGFFIIGIMLPIRLGTVPILQTMISWGIIDTLLALILVYTAMTLPLAVALMMTYFRSVPTELKEAARIDGCSRFSAFLHVVLPLATPALAACGVIMFIISWHELLIPLILNARPDVMTLPVVIASLVGDVHVFFNLMMAICLLALAPTVILVALLQRYIVEGLSAGAVKG